MSQKEAASLVLPPSIYVGPCSSASSRPFLTSNSINHVLSIGSTPASQVDGVTYHRLALTDSRSSSIAKVAEAAGAIIDAALESRNRSGKILVHCMAGRSRSPTVVVAYLMKKRNMNLKAALGQVLRARPQAVPNAGFLEQLKEMEQELFGVVTVDVEELPRREKDRLALLEDKAVDDTVRASGAKVMPP
jgi:atypical dual specificity phosphatase